jgi:hypothetical protein
MLTALTLVSNSVLHRFISLALHSGVLQLPPSIPLSSTPALLHTTLTRCPLALYAVYSWSWTFAAVPVSPCRIFCLILAGEHSGILAALKSEASWVTTLLAAIALCYNMWLKFAMLHSALFSLYLLVKASFFICTTVLYYSSHRIFNMQAVLILSDCFVHFHINATEKFMPFSKFMQ